MSDSELFVTVLYGVLHHDTGEFVYIRAGHEVPILVAPGGETSRPDYMPGQPLGSSPIRSWHNRP